MGLEFVLLESNERWVEARERLWLTADRSRVVADGDPEAAFLLAAPGQRIPIEDAERYGLVKPKKAAAAKKVAKPPEGAAAGEASVGDGGPGEPPVKEPEPEAEAEAKPARSSGKRS